MNSIKPHEQGIFTPYGQVSAYVNDEMHHDSHFHPNLGGVTQGGMSNHFPMTIMSLAGLGANDNEIKRFVKRWPRYRADVKTELGLVDKQVVTLNNWSEYLGQTNRLLEFQRVFVEGIVQFGAK